MKAISLFHQRAYVSAQIFFSILEYVLLKQQKVPFKCMYKGTVPHLHFAFCAILFTQYQECARMAESTFVESLYLKSLSISVFTSCTQDKRTKDKRACLSMLSTPFRDERARLESKATFSRYQSVPYYMRAAIRHDHLSAVVVRRRCGVVLK